MISLSNRIIKDLLIKEFPQGYSGDPIYISITEEGEEREVMVREERGREGGK